MTDEKGDALRVVVVDDSAIVRSRVAAMLREIDPRVRVFEAENLAGALRLAREQRPHLMVVDIRMPGGSGMELLAALAGGGQGAPTVAILTNYPYRQYRRRCFELGAHHFLDKSHDLPRLRQVVGRLLEERAPARLVEQRDRA